MGHTTGNEAGSLRYHSYGETRAQTGGVYTDRRFTGQTLDLSTSLHHYGTHYCDQSLGR